ncbi:MAG: orotate phosphoribosyltransferase [Magnetococcales bacterium]|nr:orotate phosphoribosyltransferase [Magnetococcales bacterium]
MSANTLQHDFLRFAIARGVLRFGSFRTKAGRDSPYFFNAGLFHGGAAIDRLGCFYAATIVGADLPCDILFGPAYKGIPLVVATAAALSREHGRDLPFAYNRKEVKDHGEGGLLIGAPLQGRVLIVDDVISAGTSVRQSVELIREAGASPAGVLVALDRQERGSGDLSATREVAASFGIPVTAIATLDDLLGLLEQEESLGEHLQAIRNYRDRYGA